MQQHMWLLDGSIKWYDPVDTVEIENCWRRIEHAESGAWGFCYGKVQKIPLYGRNGAKARNEIAKLKRIKYTDTELKDAEVQAINKLIAFWKSIERQAYSFDTTAYNQLKTNFKWIKSALDYLVKVGELSCYVLTPDGELRYEDFTGQRLNVKVIEQDITWRWYYENAKCHGVEIEREDKLHVPTISVTTIMDTYRKYSYEKETGGKRHMPYGMKQAVEEVEVDRPIIPPKKLTSRILSARDTYAVEFPFKPTGIPLKLCCIILWYAYATKQVTKLKRRVKIR